MDEKPRFYFVNEVATELRRSEASVRWLIHRGVIKTGKIGGRVVVSPPRSTGSSTRRSRRHIMHRVSPRPDSATSIRRNDVAEDTKSSLIRDARVLLSAVGVERGGNWISRAVRDYLAAPVRVPFGIYLAARVDLNAQQRRRLAERADLRYLLSYADPTGETAVRNVMRGQGVSA